MKNSFLITLYFVILGLQAQENTNFSALNQVNHYIKNNNYIFKNADLQNQLAQIAKKTAIANIFNPRIPTSAQAINNTKQQVSYLPGAAFGMPEGTFRPITMGQQYVSTFSIQPQFDIINISNWTQIKSAKINQQLTENQNNINQQNLYDKINMVYFNILSFTEQRKIIIENKEIAQNILQITTQKFAQGIARKQELNEAEINVINLQDKLEQLDFNLKIQYQMLCLFFENKINPILTQSLWDFENSPPILETKNTLLSQNANLQQQQAQQDLKTLQWQNLPVVSFVSSLNWQNLSNTAFFSDNSNWINYNYIGLKINYDFPTTVQKLAGSLNKKIQLQLLKNNALHTQAEENNKNLQLILEHQKSIQQLQNFKKIYSLKLDTYQKNFNQYKENILPLDKLLISQNDKILSKLNVITALANIGFNKSKIEINNEF